MDKHLVLEALARLGPRCPSGSEIVLAGGAALMLAGLIARGTNDGDVLTSRPKLSALHGLIADVAEEMGLPEAWLNSAVAAWQAALPPDYRTRLDPVGTFGNLTVRRLGRLDLIVMKVFALRDQDQDDLREIEPTSEEIAFVEAQLPRIATVFPDRAHRMELYLAQGAGRRAQGIEGAEPAPMPDQATSAEAPKPPRRRVR